MRGSPGHLISEVNTNWLLCCKYPYISGHTSGVYSFSFSSDSSKVATVSKDGTWKVFNTAIEYNKGQVRAYIHSFRLGLVINSFSGCLCYYLGGVCWGQDRERQAESHHDLTRGQAGGPQSGQAGQPVQRADRQTSGEHWGASLSTHCQGLQAAERDDWNAGVNALLIIGPVLFWRPVSLYCGRQAHQNIP